SRGLVYNREGDFEQNGLTPAVGVSPYGYPGAVEGVGYATINPVTGEPYPAPITVGFTDAIPDPRCPTELGGSTEFPNSVQGNFGPGVDLCSFNHAALSANLASTKRTSLSVMTNYDISDNVEFFGRF